MKFRKYVAYREVTQRQLGDELTTTGATEAGSDALKTVVKAMYKVLADNFSKVRGWMDASNVPGVREMVDGVDWQQASRAAEQQMREEEGMSDDGVPTPKDDPETLATNTSDMNVGDDTSAASGPPMGGGGGF